MELKLITKGAAEQDIVNEKMEQQLRENKEYNLQVQEYYRQRKE
jgi:hypothetical protein